MSIQKRPLLPGVSFCHVWVACLLIFSLGCGGGVNKTERELLGQLIPVSGNVTLQGKPLSAASITLHPIAREGMTQSAYAVSDDKGAFELSTLMPGLTVEQCKGVLPGDYRIVVSKVVQPDGSPLPADVSEADAPATKQAVPAIYTNPETSPLMFQVSPGAELIIELK